jgi:polysaccharide export outer membrane protein
LQARENLLQQAEDYQIGPQDVLEIKVWDNTDMTKKAVVTLDGFISYHFIGKIEAKGLTTGELAEKISKKLADGYIINPQVTIEVIEYKSQKIYISGEAIKPGTYYLTKKTSLVEAISMAGGPTNDADREVIIVRPNVSKVFSDTSLLKNEMVHKTQLIIDLRSALEGDLSQNIYIQNGDSIFIPRAKSFYIMGEVKRPGKYNLKKGMTVLNAISLAGGETVKATIERTRIIRAEKGKKIEKKVKLDELVQSDDIIIVPESFF